MHYKNGREAKNGDKVMIVDGYAAGVAGILYDATPGNDYCNGKLAPLHTNPPCPNLKECLHLDDVKAAIAEFDPQAVPGGLKNPPREDGGPTPVDGCADAD